MHRNVTISPHILFYFQIVLISAVVLHVGANALEEITCRKGQYLHNGYTKYSNQIQLGATCKRCPHGTFNGAENNQDRNCADCRAVSV